MLELNPESKGEPRFYAEEQQVQSVLSLAAVRSMNQDWVEVREAMGRWRPQDGGCCSNPGGPRSGTGSGGWSAGDGLVARGLPDAWQRDQNTEGRGWEYEEVLERRWPGGVGAFTRSPDREGSGDGTVGQAGVALVPSSIGIRAASPSLENVASTVRLPLQNPSPVLC